MSGRFFALARGAGPYSQNSSSTVLHCQKARTLPRSLIYHHKLDRPERRHHPLLARSRGLCRHRPQAECVSAPMNAVRCSDEGRGTLLILMLPSQCTYATAADSTLTARRT